MDTELHNTMQILKKYGQEHLLSFWDELTLSEREILLSQIHNTDFEDKSAWSKQFDWVMDTAIKMKKAFKKYI